MSDSFLWPHGVEPARRLCPWNFPGKNTVVGCHFLLQGIFPTQGLNPCLPRWRGDSLLLSHWGSPHSMYTYTCTTILICLLSNIWSNIKWWNNILFIYCCKNLSSQNILHDTLLWKQCKNMFHYHEFVVKSNVRISVTNYFYYCQFSTFGNNFLIKVF